MQTTAILGWGSLLWDPRNLNYVTEIGWLEDGPILPIEFARISKDGRLTLVITENGTYVKTYFAMSNNIETNEAIKNLSKREGSENIGFYIKETNTFFPEDFKHKQAILDWIENYGMTAVIWTNLGENWKIKNEKGEIIRNIQPDNRIEYLKELKENTSVLAEEYIRRTPIQIQTNFRKLIEEELNWTPITLEINTWVEEKNELDNNLTFSKMAGTGELNCLDCKHSEVVLSNSRFSNGFQCQSCGKFHSFQRNTKPATCDCGGKFEQNKNVFCSNCKSYNITYKLRFLS
ncbi:hypothetical protein RRM46_002045 [Flavobacterium psychrophilum]|nr:hypothetical protein [Flavobacterium psychrophilum]